MRVSVTPNGNRAWTWMVLNEWGYPLHYGWCYGRNRAQRKAERIATRYSEKLDYTFKRD